MLGSGSRSMAVCPGSPLCALAVGSGSRWLSGLGLWGAFSDGAALPRFAACPPRARLVGVWCILRGNVEWGLGAVLWLRFGCSGSSFCTEACVGSAGRSGPNPRPRLGLASWLRVRVAWWSLPGLSSRGRLASLPSSGVCRISRPSPPLYPPPLNCPACWLSVVA